MNYGRDMASGTTLPGKVPSVVSRTCSKEGDEPATGERHHVPVTDLRRFPPLPYGLAQKMPVRHVVDEGGDSALQGDAVPHAVTTVRVTVSGRSAEMVASPPSTKRMWTCPRVVGHAGASAVRWWPWRTKTSPART